MTTEASNTQGPPLWQLAMAALQRAVRKVMIDAKANGTKVVIWRDGQVVETYVDEIPPLDERDIPPPALSRRVSSEEKQSGEPR